MFMSYKQGLRRVGVCLYSCLSYVCFVSRLSVKCLLLADGIKKTNNKIDVCPHVIFEQFQTNQILGAIYMKVK